MIINYKKVIYCALSTNRAYKVSADGTRKNRVVPLLVYDMLTDATKTFFVFTGLKLRKMFIIGQRNNTLEIFLHSCTLYLLPRGTLMVGGWERDLQQRETDLSVGTTERSVSRNGFFYLP